MKIKLVFSLILALFALVSFALLPEILNISGIVDVIPGLAMAGAPFIGMTPQQKQVMVNKARGVPIWNSQGTSRNVYDSLAIVANQTHYTFFDQVSNRPFPLSNLNDNKLDDMEDLVIQRISFSYITVGEGDAIDEVSPVALLEPFHAGIFNIRLENNVVMKDYSLRKLASDFNPYSQYEGQSVIVGDTYPTIPPQTRFTVNLRLPDGWAAPGTETHIVCLLDGAGAIGAARSNF